MQDIAADDNDCGQNEGGARLEEEGVQLGEEFDAVDGGEVSSTAGGGIVYMDLEAILILYTWTYVLVI